MAPRAGLNSHPVALAKQTPEAYRSGSAGATLIAETEAASSPLRAVDGEHGLARGVPLSAWYSGDMVRRAEVELLPNGRFRFNPENSRFEDLQDVRSLYLVPCRDEHGDVIDIAAFGASTIVPWTLTGRANMLGAEQLFEPRLGRLVVHRGVFSWLRSGRRGIVLIDPARCAWLLDGIGLAVEDGKHRLELLKALSRRPDVTVEVG